jgi:hypothetical protein
MRRKCQTHLILASLFDLTFFFLFFIFLSLLLTFSFALYFFFVVFFLLVLVVWEEKSELSEIVTLVTIKWKLDIADKSVLRPSEPEFLTLVFGETA